MSIFDNIKEVIQEFVNDNMITDRDGRLITRKVNKCLLEYFESDDYKMNKPKYNLLKKKNYQMRKLIQHLREENEKEKMINKNLKKQYYDESCNLEDEVNSVILENNKKINDSWFSKICSFVYLSIKYYLIVMFYICLFSIILNMFI